MQHLRSICPYIDGVVAKGSSQGTAIRALLNLNADAWVPDAHGTAACRRKVRESAAMLDDLRTPSDHVRECAHTHKAICAYAGACPSLVTALDEIKRAPDERLSYCVGRALTVLLQTRRAAEKMDAPWPLASDSAKGEEDPAVLSLPC